MVPLCTCNTSTPIPRSILATLRQETYRPVDFATLGIRQSLGSAKFREDVGPPPVVHLRKRVIANLDFIERLSSPGSKDAFEPDAQTDSNNETSTSARLSVSSVSQATRPPTSGESLRKRYREVDKTHGEPLAMDNSSTSTTDSTCSHRDYQAHHWPTLSKLRKILRI